MIVVFAGIIIALFILQLGRWLGRREAEQEFQFMRWRWNSTTTERREPMKTQAEILKIERLKVIAEADYGGCGEIYWPAQREPMTVVWSFNGGWEHVSVSYSKRTPTWDEMCKVKDMFWNDNETVVQYHPPKSEYVNLHEHCLHLWRQKNTDFEMPPKEYV